MKQPQHTSLFAMLPLMGNPWPTRLPCKAVNSWEGDAQGDTLQLAELQRVDSDHQRWILFIAPPGRPTIARLEEHGINPARVLIVHGPKIKNWQQMLERTLGSGHCAAVLTWLPEQIELDHAKLQRLGQQAGVLTRFFGMQKAKSCLPSATFGGQDVYLNH